MNRDMHERARELLSLGAQVTTVEERWLEGHLAECEACRAYRAEIGQVLATLRAVPFAARPDVVRSTQMQVRVRARELRQRRERLWLVFVSCALVTLFALISNAFLWQGFAWLGRRAQVPDTVWQVGFAIFWIAPTIAASFLFLAYGMHFADRNGSARG